MDYVHQFLDIILHLDVYLNQWLLLFGPWIYLILFAVVFCETGLVVTPFLPGDSLLFALGALSATEGSILNIYVLSVVMVTAALMGDLVNYSVGYHIGPKIFSKEESIWFNRTHLIKTQGFYEKHGGKTIILARFIPIVRTFAPFVAGIGKMKFMRFATFCVVGALSWVPVFLAAGYYFGNLPSVKRNFHVVIVAIVLISVMPIVVEWLKAKRSRLAI